MSGPNSPAPEAAELQRLLRLRLGGRTALHAALLDALFGRDQCDALDARQRRRLLAVLEGRDDVALAELAWSGNAGRSALCLQVDVMTDGSATAAEREALCAGLVALLRQADWLPAALALRSVVVSDGVAL